MLGWWAKSRSESEFLIHDFTSASTLFGHLGGLRFFSSYHHGQTLGVSAFSVLSILLLQPMTNNYMFVTNYIQMSKRLYKSCWTNVVYKKFISRMKRRHMLTTIKRKTFLTHFSSFSNDWYVKWHSISTVQNNLSKCVRKTDI